MVNEHESKVLPVSVSDCWGLLRTQELGRLAVIVDGAPDIFPVNYAVDHGSVVFRTAPGSKLTVVDGSSPVAFEVDHYDRVTGLAWSVVLHGDARRIREMDELLNTVDLPLSPWHSVPKHHFVRISPGRVTGRRFQVSEDEGWRHSHHGQVRAAAD